VITQISFKVLPSAYVGELSAPVKSNNNSALRVEIEQRLKSVFDARGVFQ
jgi:glycolate oxidase FAD binding subunit